MAESDLDLSDLLEDTDAERQRQTEEMLEGYGDDDIQIAILKGELRYRAKEHAVEVQRLNARIHELLKENSMIIGMAHDIYALRQKVKWQDDCIGSLIRELSKHSRPSGAWEAP